MMKLIIYIIFLIPLINCWWMLMLYMMLMIIMMLMYFPVTSFYSSLSYSFGMDMVSYCMIMLTIWIMFLMILASSKIKFMMNSSNEFLFILNMLLLILILSFSTNNMLMFYIFFESSLIPTLFLIFGWGYQPERLMAGFYLLFYTLFASLPLLLSIFYVYNNTFTLYYFMINLNINSINFYIYMAMILAFLVKMPMLFLHFWLPKAHVEAPVSGSMILAGILLKLGGYGLFRVFYFMNIYLYYNYIMLLMSLLGSFMIGILCMSQVDIKSLIAYSSVSHMGLVICGIMTLNCYGMLGSLVMMIGHGLCSSGMFSLANILYERSHSRSLYINKGIITFIPSISLFWFMLSCNNMASPPSLNMLGEIMIINSVMSWSSLSFLFLMLSSFLSCCYSIYLYAFSQHGYFYTYNTYISYGSVREFYLLLFHWLPLNMLFLKVDIFTLWI
uniref:NADH-ubiquinone oxidoreductase chain 4 n=1 Tax=Idiostolus sp. TaxID=2931296 RepID=A0A8T9ZYV6_9HEMI|nr:NADH dehydrogenase subunit 4 [Idiostolus sp.]